MKVRAFAKLNLSLRVLGLRADGYHELRTVFQSIELHDTLTVRAVRGPLRLTCDDPACPVDDTNLVWRAADRLWRASGRRGRARGVAIDLKKQIPMQAGLGGGSSDAAAALVALAALWKLRGRHVHDTAQAIGADVPYFLEGGTVLGLERGNLLFPLPDDPAAWVVVVVPPFGVSTAEAYGWWDAAEGRPQPRAANDLQAPVVRRHPEIGRLVRALTTGGAFHAAMSGSGSAVFGLFRSRAGAERAGRLLAGGPAGARRHVLVTRTLNRAAYQRLAGLARHRIHLPFAPRGLHCI